MIEQSKSVRYMELVEKRKKYCFKGLLNPSQIDNGIYDKDTALGPWSLWQGNLDAKILVIGQDWGDEDYYITNKGRDDDKNPTNVNLMKLFQKLNINIGKPSQPNANAPTFFTNAILGIKKNGMSSKVKTIWEKESTEEFLEPLIEIIQPKIIITLGKVAYSAVARIYGLSLNESLNTLIKNNPIEVKNVKIFAMYHCGRIGLANRSLNKQIRDWEGIKKYLD